MVFLGFLSIVFDLVGLALLYAATLNILNPDFLSDWLSEVDLFSDMFSDKPLHSLLLTAILVVIFIGKNGVTFLISKLQVNSAYAMAAEVSERQFKAFLNRKMLTQKMLQSSDYVHQLYVVPASMPDGIILSSIQCISEIIFMILAILIVTVVKPSLLLLLVLTILPITFLLLYLSRKKLVDYGNQVNKAIPRMMSSVNDSVHGFTDIRLHHKEEFFKNRFLHWRNSLFKSRRKAYLIHSAVPARIMESAAVLCLFIIALYTFMFNDTENMTSLLAMFAALAFRVLPSINRIIGSFNTFHAASFILDILSRVEIIEKSTKYNGKFSFNKQLELKNISLHLEGTGDVLSDLNLKVEKGKMIGIKGASGEGKTSLLNVILCLYQPNKGEILVDGKNVETDTGNWQSILAYVEQNSFMLDGSIIENIAFGDTEPSEDRVREALQKVSLSTWVEGLNHGIATRIGELGGRISAGQQQRLAIARALYSNAEIFIFDEATNALDQATKEEVMQSILNLKQLGYTIIMAAHDLSTLESSDKIYELKNGKLYEETV